jgi:hypothetical protein
MEHAMRFLTILLICLLLSTPLAQAEEQEPGPELVALGITLINCVAPISVGDSPARIAEEQNLPELPPEHAGVFITSEASGRAFAIPDAMGNVVLTVSEIGVCQVLVRELSPERFKEAMDKVFDPTISPWKKIQDETKEDSITKSYVGEFNSGVLIASVSVRDKPLDNALQALLTVSRIKDDIHSFTFID